MSDPDIYAVGGTVQASGGIYIRRRCDDELLALCRAGRFAYVLSPRQTGKSSMMVRAAAVLEEQGTRSATVDLTRIGNNLTAEQWYLGVLVEIQGTLTLKTDVRAWWREQSHLGVTQRLTRFFQDILLAEVPSPVVIFVDEIDTTLGLPFSDDFFAAIRATYNARALTAAFRRLTFVLIGVATPSDLIHDPARTPFNIGERVDLSDFIFEEALPLARGLAADPDEARRALTWVLDVTGGHPYLTQRLCQAMATERRDAWSRADVNRVVASTFFGRMREQDSNLAFIRDMLTRQAPDKQGVLATYAEIRSGVRPVPDDERSVIKAHLKLSGVVRSVNGCLEVRNPLYATVFDSRWITEQAGAEAQTTVAATTTPSVIRIGRALDNDIVISDAYVSAYHVEATLTPDGLEVRDLGSPNGVIVYGQRFTQGVLPPEAAIQIGPNITIPVATIMERLLSPDRTRALSPRAPSATPPLSVELPPPSPETDETSLLQPLVFGRGLVYEIPRDPGPGPTLIRDMDILVRTGELVVVTGASGVGKTSLLRLLGGKIRPTTGTLITTVGRQGIGYVTGHSVLARRLTLHDALVSSTMLRAPSSTSQASVEARAGDVMRDLGLLDEAQTRISRLSSGQRRRSELALALMLKPRLLLLDEPTSGLDPSEERRFIDLLRKLANEGVGVVLASNAPDAIERADRIALLVTGGRLVFWGTPDEVRSYFRVNELGQIYDRLRSEGTPASWRKQFVESRSYALLHTGIQAAVRDHARTSQSPAPPSPTTDRRLRFRRIRWLLTLTWQLLASVSRLIWFVTIAFLAAALTAGLVLIAALP